MKKGKRGEKRKKERKKEREKKEFGVFIYSCILFLISVSSLI
jgi:hypothetical protein